MFDKDSQNGKLPDENRFRGENHGTAPGSGEAAPGFLSTSSASPGHLSDESKETLTYFSEKQFQNVQFPAPLRVPDTPVDPPDIGMMFEPLDPGDIIDRSFDILKNNSKQLSILSLFWLAPVVILVILYIASTAILARQGMETYNTVTSCFGFIFIPAWIFIGMTWFIYVASVTGLTSEYLRGKKISYKEGLAFFTDNWLKLLATMAFPVVLIGFIAGGGLGGIMTIMLQGTAGTSIIAVLFAIFIVIFCAYLTFSFSLVPQVAVLEKKGVLGTLRRSWDLFRVSKEGMVRVITIPSLVHVLTQILSSVPYIGILLFVFFAPLSVISKTLIYYDIRIRTEAYDLEYRIDKSGEEFQKTFHNRV